MDFRRQEIVSCSRDLVMLVVHFVYIWEFPKMNGEEGLSFMSI